MVPQIVVLIGGIIIVALIALVIFFERKAANSNSSDDSGNYSSENIKSEIILNSIDDGVMLVDANNTIQLFNPGASRITGWKTEEATGIDYKAVINLIDQKGEPYTDQDSPFIKALTAKAAIRDSDAFYQTKSKTTISLDIGVTPLFDDEEEFQGYIAIFRDVSAKKREEQQRADFISTASHEMRTPVAAIEGYLSLALNSNVSTIDNKARGFLLRAHENTKHLGKLFQDLLTSSKAEDGRLENNPSVVEMGDLIVNLVNDFKVIAEAKNINLELLLGGERNALSEGKSINVVKPLYFAHVDPIRIKEAVYILFDNALKYTDTGKISVGLTGNETVIQVRVQDTGIGIEPENVNHLFQKFYRIDNSQTRTIGGTGLGLFICKKIVDMYGGRIWAESEKGVGSTFYINLPRLSSAQAEDIKSREANKGVVINNTTSQQSN